VKACVLLGGLFAAIASDVLTVLVSDVMSAAQ